MAKWVVRHSENGPTLSQKGAKEWATRRRRRFREQVGAVSTAEASDSVGTDPFFREGRERMGHPREPDRGGR